MKANKIMKSTNYIHLNYSKKGKYYTLRKAYVEILGEFAASNDHLKKLSFSIVL